MSAVNCGESHRLVGPVLTNQCDARTCLYNAPVIARLGASTKVSQHPQDKRWRIVGLRCQDWSTSIIEDKVFLARPALGSESDPGARVRTWTSTHPRLAIWAHVRCMRSSRTSMVREYPDMVCQYCIARKQHLDMAATVDLAVHQSVLHVRRMTTHAPHHGSLHYVEGLGDSCCALVKGYLHRWVLRKYIVSGILQLHVLAVTHLNCPLTSYKLPSDAKAG